MLMIDAFWKLMLLGVMAIPAAFAMIIIVSVISAVIGFIVSTIKDMIKNWKQ